MTAIGGRPKPELCFLLERLRWMLLPKERYSNSLSGCGSNTQPSNLRGWHFTTELLPSPRLIEKEKSHLFVVLKLTKAIIANSVKWTIACCTLFFSIELLCSTFSLSSLKHFQSCLVSSIIAFVFLNLTKPIIAKTSQCRAACCILVCNTFKNLAKQWKYKPFCTRSSPRQWKVYNEVSF